MRNAYKIWVGKREGKRPLGIPRCKREDNIRIDLRETEWEDMDWIHLAQDSDWWRALVDMATKLRILLKAGNFLTS
jgi:hypothetical protein